ncbi:MAG TPA: ATP-dependent RecD-like DNA helicase, partial [Thermoanaerobacterales bacterium]|nr:ATP-dependent RecD-like DNA helicase [Thermoanaerobacterales bacterium]
FAASPGYGDESIEILSQNPFRLADEVYGIGFKTADKIARKMGMKYDSLERLSAGLKFALQESANEGHVYMPKDQLFNNAAKLLEVDKGLLDQPLAALLEKGDVILDTSWGKEDVYLAAFFVCEESVARQLFLLSSMVEKSLDITSQDMDRVEKNCGIKMAKKQRQALKMAAKEGVLIITGGPGTGKTTAIKSLIEFFKQHKLSIALAAPTGRAAKRMNEATGQDAKTIHRLLEYKAYEEGGMAFGKNQDHMLEHDVIIIDEISMVDIVLMYHLLSAIKPGARLIMVGDADQLPSVGPGSVLRDMIKSELIPIVVLDEVFRQAKESMIVVNAHRINRGLYPYLNVKDKDFYFEQKLEPKEIENDILELASKRLPSYGNFDAIEDIQVLTPMKKGAVGVFNLNKKLQGILNPPSPDKSELKHRFYTFRKGDKVMQVKNNYDKEVFNGDLGRIIEIDEDEGQVLVSFAEPDKDIEVMYELQDMDELNLAYALSVHKSQGSEFPVVILPITTQHYIMLQRNLIYTAITRAKKLLVMVGTKQAIRIAIRNNQAHIRYSRLDERIAQEFEGII